MPRPVADHVNQPAARRREQAIAPEVQRPSGGHLEGPIVLTFDNNVTGLVDHGEPTRCPEGTGLAIIRRLRSAASLCPWGSSSILALARELSVVDK